MKRIILSLIFLISIGIQAQSVEEQVRTAYDEGDFNAAIELLETELKAKKSEGMESAELYYNLGNAYYRMNELGKARLNFERALLLDPSDGDIKHNIEFVTSKIEDKILMADSFFVAMWFKSVQNIFTSNTWANVGIVSFLVIVASLFLFFFTREVNLKKIAFYVGLVFVVICIFANVFSHYQKTDVEIRDTAVVMSEVATVYSSPDRNSKDVFTLHEGSKMQIKKKDRSWLEIQIADGSVGWIEREKIEII